MTLGFLMDKTPMTREPRTILSSWTICIGQGLLAEARELWTRGR